MGEVTLTCQRCGTKSTATGGTRVLLQLGWQEIGPLHGECDCCDHSLFFCPTCTADENVGVLAQVVKHVQPSLRLPLAEAERQVVLLALAHLSVERPGWENLLNDIARRIDKDVEGRAEMFDAFRTLRENEKRTIGGR